MTRTIREKVLPFGKAIVGLTVYFTIFALPLI